jgi:hypothetical protein
LLVYWSIAALMVIGVASKKARYIAGNFLAESADLRRKTEGRADSKGLLPKGKNPTLSLRK